ncbi:MAG: hypothetical protein IVW57_15625 [Ktedonobacterales bacterium]|nr:hypothetical protein [Ktedonobacterales bacterium]
MSAPRPSASRALLGVVLAWVSLGLALLFPVALVVNAVTLVASSARGPRPFPWLLLVYTGLDYLVIPVILAAIVAGHTALMLTSGGAGYRPAKVALNIAYPLLIALVGMLFIVIPLLVAFLS